MFGRPRFAAQAEWFRKSRAKPRPAPKKRVRIVKRRIVKRRPVRLVVARKVTAPKLQARVALPLPSRKAKPAGGQVLRFRAPLMAPKPKPVAVRRSDPALMSRAGARAGAASSAMNLTALRAAGRAVAAHHTVGPMPGVDDRESDADDAQLDEEESFSPEESDSVGPEDDESSSASDSSGEEDSFEETDEGEPEEEEDVGALVSFDGDMGGAVGLTVLGVAAVAAIAIGYTLGKRKKRGR